MIQLFSEFAIFRFSNSRSKSQSCTTALPPHALSIASMLK